MEKTLIEESSVDLLELFDEVSEESRNEKHSVPAINKMSYYWTRKPLIVGRAVALTSTLGNIEDVRKLLGLNGDKRAYKYIPDIELYKKKLGQNPSEIKILDPFGGGGNLIFEVKRLGLDINGADYNPLSYLIMKGTLEYPSKYGAKLVEDFKNYAKQIIDKTFEDVGKFYKNNESAYLWVWCCMCPHCNQRVPLTNQMWIVKTPRQKIGVRFHVTKDKNFTTELVVNMTDEEGKQYTQKNGKAICISCKNAIDYDGITSDIATRKDREMVAIQIQKISGKDYISPTNIHRKLYCDSVRFFKSKEHDLKKEGLIPDEQIKAAHRKMNSLWYYGIKIWSDYFSERQLLVLTTFLKNSKIICGSISDKEYSKIISLYIGMILCKTINSNAIGNTWNVQRAEPGTITMTKRQALAFNHVEINPFVKVRGSFYNALKNVLDGITFAKINSGKISLENKSVTELPKEKYDIIITDPPYFDDIQYGEYSEFFYVWLYRCVNEHFPELPRTVPLDEDFCESWGRFGTKELAHEFARKGLIKSFESMNHTLKDDGLLVVFFAHSSIAAWNILLESLRSGHFKVVSSYSIHTENTSNPLAQGKTSFMSSIVVACRKISEERTAYFEDIIPQTEDSVKSMIDKISVERLLVLPITDLLVMVYGKVLEIGTQFTEIKSYEKGFTPDFETIIKSSQGFIMKTIITRLTERSLNTLGSLTAFYLLTKIFYRGIMLSGDLTNIARTYAINVNLLEKNNIGKKEGDIIRLFYLHENELDLKPDEIDRGNIHQQLCYLVQVSKKQGATKIKSIFTGDYKNFRVDDLKQIILLLIKSLKLRINKNEKLDDAEKEELMLLEAIADVMGIKTSTEKKGGMDEFL